MSSDNEPGIPPAPRYLAGTLADWHYSSFVATGGHARLRTWATDTGHLAVVTDLGRGTSVTNAAEYIKAELRIKYGRGDLAVIEHYTGVDEHWDLVSFNEAGHPFWSRVWPVSAEHPQHEALTAWVREYGPVIGIPVPARSNG